MAEKKSLIKIRKKFWYPILSKGIFDGITLGQTLVYEGQQMLGKYLSINLMTLMNDYKKQNTNLKFKVTKVKDNKGYAEVVGFMLSVSSIKRLVRRGYIKIELSFPCMTSDKKQVIVKTIMLINGKCKNSIRSMIRSTTVQLLIKMIESMTYDNFVNDVINGKPQSVLFQKIKKMYPLRVCEIRRFDLVEENVEKKEQSNELTDSNPIKDINENLKKESENIESLPETQV